MERCQWWELIAVFARLMICFDCMSCFLFFLNGGEMLWRTTTFMIDHP
jgi:hypothetical protein